MDIVMAPGRVGGVSAPAVAQAMVSGWCDVRPGDAVVVRPLGRGGRGTVDLFEPDGLAAARLDPVGMRPAVADPTGVPEPEAGRQLLTVEVVGSSGLPTIARFVFDPTLRRPTAWIEAAEVSDGDRETGEAVLDATTWGVGELVGAALAVGARRVVVAPGDVGAMDGGAGALAALGFRPRMADGSGLKVGGRELRLVRSVDRGWAPEATDIEFVVAADTVAGLDGLLSGGSDVPDSLVDAVATWAGVVGRDLGVDGLAARPGTAAGGGLAFGLAAGLGADVRVGAAVLADALELDAVLRRTQCVVTVASGADGDASTSVASYVRGRAATFGVQCLVLGPPGQGAAQGAAWLARAVAEHARRASDDDPTTLRREHHR